MTLGYGMIPVSLHFIKLDKSMSATIDSFVHASCEVCRVGAPTLSQKEREPLLLQLPDWELIEQDGVEQLQRVFSFNSYGEGVAFTQEVASIAEEQGHHPVIMLEWGKVTVRWWTHKINGIHKNDVIMAAKTERLNA